MVEHGGNPDFGVMGPDGFLDQHYRQGGIWNGNTELPVSLVLYALTLANRYKVIVETGVNNGAGATLWLVLAALLNSGMYHGVDIDPGSIQKARDAITQVCPQGPATFYKGNALDVLPANFAPASIDLLFVDDDHHRSQVEQEVAAFLPLMKPGGLLCFHDIIGIHESDIWPVIEPLGAIRIVDVQHTQGKPFGGLGVIKVK